MPNNIPKVPGISKLGKRNRPKPVGQIPSGGGKVTHKPTVKRAKSVRKIGTK
jgi:hypothetical protein